MNYFHYRQNRLFCEQVPVLDIAGRLGTPFYLYSQSFLEDQFQRFDNAFSGISHLICYAVKANSNLAVLNLFHRLGAGFDIVSGGELKRALRAGGNPRKIVFSGVGKAEEEIDLALQKNILQFNVESDSELEMLQARARTLGKTAAFSLRVNPDVDPKTHPYIATGLRRHKFGVPMEHALDLYRKAKRSRHLRIGGIGFHIGSQITRLSPFVDAAKKLKSTILNLRSSGIEIQHFDLGGGLGIRYEEEEPPTPEDYGAAIRRIVADLHCTILLEPGRALVGGGGILVTRVLFTKENAGKRFVVVDAGMNDLLRPSLYGSFHAIDPVVIRRNRRPELVDVVGPVCESGDFLARDRKLPRVVPGEHLAVRNAGAYGFALSSNYNTRPRIPEVFVKDTKMKVIRKRETLEDLIRGEARSPL